MIQLIWHGRDPVPGDEATVARCEWTGFLARFNRGLNTTKRFRLGGRSLFQAAISPACEITSDQRILAGDMTEKQDFCDGFILHDSSHDVKKEFSFLFLMLSGLL